MKDIIYDNECREYREGWNAANAGAHFLSNPYSCVSYEGELYRLWQVGFNECERTWNSDGPIPESYPPDVVKFSFTIRNQEPYY